MPSIAVATGSVSQYRARNPRATPLYRLFETLYEEVMRRLQDAGLLTEERTELLLSWRHSGFSVYNRVRVEPEDQSAVERLARYIMRPPISLEQGRSSSIRPGSQP